MDSKPTKAFVQRVLGALKRTNRKVVTLDALSRLVGLYPDVLGDALSYFEPMIRMDSGINCRDLEPALRAYLEIPMEKSKKRKKESIRVSKKTLNSYASIADFVYKEMTNVGGLVDTATSLDDEKLTILKRVVDNELKRRAKEEKKK